MRLDPQAHCQMTAHRLPSVYQTRQSRDQPPVVRHILSRSQILGDREVEGVASSGSSFRDVRTFSAAGTKLGLSQSSEGVVETKLEKHEESIGTFFVAGGFSARSGTHNEVKTE